MAIYTGFLHGTTYAFYTTQYFDTPSPPPPPPGYLRRYDIPGDEGYLRRYEVPGDEGYYRRD